MFQIAHCCRDGYSLIKKPVKNLAKLASIDVDNESESSRSILVLAIILATFWRF